MKKFISVGFAVFFVSVSGIFAQNPQPSPTPARQRVIIVGQPSPTPVSNHSPTPTSPKVIVVTNNPSLPSPTPLPRPQTSATPIIVGSAPIPNASPTPQTYPQQLYPPPIAPINYNVRSLGFAQLKNKIAEAKRQMITRPVQTAISDPSLMTDPALVTGIVRIAFYDWKTQKIDYTTITKDKFLSTDGDSILTSTSGKWLRLRTLRANGVNTPVVIFDENGQTMLPLVVQYPVEKGGRLAETAYYISTHPGVVTPEIVSAGKFYVRNTIDLARDKLREKGIFIQPQIADIAERLSTVEHVDHQRFRSEYQPNIYNDIYTLYALNEGDTYRFSVSSAGAGGMVQMIPATYRMIRSRYYNVGLMPDFVEGMRNHVNASQAMLLYMQMTWDDLNTSSTINYAIQTGVATPAQLMAAGYNSNPSRLASYINRGGANWTSLIPRETQMYLQIYSSLDRFVPMSPRIK